MINMSAAPNRLIPIVLSTVTMVFFSITPLISFINVFCCAGLIIGGFVGIFVYNKQLRNTNYSLAYKDGVMIGLLSGILSSIIVTGINVLISLFSDVNMINEIMKISEEIGYVIPSEFMIYIEKISKEFETYGFSPTLTIVGFIMNLIIYPLFGILGGIIGVSIITRKRNQTV